MNYLYGLVGLANQLSSRFKEFGAINGDGRRLTHPVPTFLPQQVPHIFTTSDRCDTLPGEKSSYKNHNQVSSFGLFVQDSDRL